MAVPFSATTIDLTMGSIENHLMRSYGTDASMREMRPLAYYVDSGRASTGFLKRLVNTQPVKVADALHKGGSDRDVIKRVKRVIGYAEEAPC